MFVVFTAQQAIKTFSGVRHVFLVVIVAPWSTNQSERSKFSLDQSESRISPMWLMWRHNHCFNPRDPIE